jgi:hypothetical protein
MLITSKKDGFKMNLNIVSLDIPYPPNYGGAIDIFFRIKALAELNCKITLHCFYSDRQPAFSLEAYCEKVYYYPRKQKRITRFLSLKPYLVASRDSVALLSRLLENNYPIFFDGLQSTFLADKPDLIKRKKYVRIHNLESQYMKNLACSEKSIIMKMGLYLESIKYRLFEKKIGCFDFVFPISNPDKTFYAKYNKKIKTIPPFHGNKDVQSLIGTGKYILYHGNFNVSENITAIRFLLDNVFNGLDFSIIIAGMNASEKLSSFQNDKIKIVNNPNKHHMNLLIREAQINILPTFQATGVKLKLINSLYIGRHCLVNPKMIEPTPNLEELCVICDSPDHFITKIREYMEKPFNREMAQKRQDILSKILNNRVNAKLIFEEMKAY